MKDTLILKDGTEIELESYSSLSELKVLSADKADFVKLWDKMTDDNLSDVEIKSGAGVVAAKYTNLTLVNETSSITADGILTSFNIREKTDVENRLDALEAGQEVQNTAIDDLATTVAAESEV